MGAPHLLENLAAIGVTVVAQGGNLIVRPWSAVSDDLREALGAAKPVLIDLLTRRYRLTRAESDVAHAEPWNDAAIARFEARARWIRRLGFTDRNAGDLAEQLHLRDVHCDYRHLCVECRHFHPGRCNNFKDAHLASGVIGRDLATMFQDCGGFDPGRWQD